MNDTQVLIVGAGPTGLVLALWLTRQGVKVRIIDKTSEPGTTSRALVVHARTLEFYRQIGLADEVIARGLKFLAANLWVGGRKVAHVELGEMGKGLSPYPFMVIFPQDEHEKLLIEQLKKEGIEVEREKELLSFSDQSQIKATIRTKSGAEEPITASYIAGCDGAHSKVREVIQANFSGATYSRMFYVADAQATGPVADGELHLALDDAEFLGVFPLAGQGRARLIGTIDKSAESGGKKLRWEDVSQVVIDRLKVDVKKINWFSTYHVHHRVADSFHKGNAFLLGDAAHIHSPVGGQGMNTGIGDAINLAWKLAGVLQGTSKTSLLDTYAIERRAFAERLVATTDQAFTLVTKQSALAKFTRLKIVPQILPRLVSFKSMRRLMFKTVSQVNINYRMSPIAAGSMQSLRGGDRLPWVPNEQAAEKSNFDALKSQKWQVHTYGTLTSEASKFCKENDLAFFEFPFSAGARHAGLEESSLYLIRPDGYIGWTGTPSDLDSLKSYWDGHIVSAR